MGKFNCKRCCDNPCVCGASTPPTITITGYTGGGWNSVSDCCKEQVFTPNSSLISRCCANLFEKSWDQQCVRKAWAFNMTFPYETAPPTCPPDPDKYCCPDPPLIHIGTQTIDYFEKHRLRLQISFDKPTIIVSFGRDNFTCSGVTECKWFMKVKVCYEVTSAYQYDIGWTRTLTTVSVNSCFDANTMFDGTETSPSYPVSDSCDAGWLGCSSDTGPVCFERIKIWDTLPSDGIITFEDSDTGSSCETKPTCADILYGESQICFAPAGSLGDCNPCWYPYSIVDNPTTYTCGGETIDTVFARDCSEDPCLILVQGCDPPTICPVVTQTLPCESVAFGTDDDESCDCLPRFLAEGTICPTAALDAGGAPVSCGFFANSSNPSPAFTSNFGVCMDTPCETDCCNYLDCGTCPVCVPKYIPLTWTGVFIGSQEISVNTTCSNYNDPPADPCCIDYAVVSLSVDFA
jgi:hypothetical protein